MKQKSVPIEMDGPDNWSIILAVVVLLALGLAAKWLIFDRLVYCDRMHVHRSQETVDACNAKHRKLGKGVPWRVPDKETL